MVQGKVPDTPELILNEGKLMIRVLLPFVLSLFIFNGCASRPEQMQVNMTDLPIGRYRIYELSGESQKAYGPAGRFVTLLEGENGLVVQGLMDVSTDTDVFLPIDHKAGHNGNVFLWHAQMKNDAIYVDLHACYFGDIRMVFDPQ